MPAVSNLKLELQLGTDNVLVATWGFNESSSGGGSTTTRVPRVGEVVSIKPGSRYYNGVAIPSWVMARQWIVYQIRGDRAVINRSPGSNYHIMSPIHINNISTTVSTVVNTTPNTLDHFTVKWQYATGNGVWFEGSSGDTAKDVRNATYSIPSNATKVKCTVTPVSKTYNSNGNSVPYWTGTAVAKEYLTYTMPPGQLSAPSVQLDKFTLKASLENITDEKCDQVEFEVYKGNTKFTSGIQSVVTARATYSCKVDAGFKYRVRCRAVNLYDNTKVYGKWSNYSSELETVPAAVTDVFCEVESNNSVKVSWTGNSTAKSYVIEYTTNKLYFDSSSEVSSITVTNTYVYLNGLEKGKEWFFRVKATNGQGDSPWSDIVYKIVGTKPQPPTTWSLTSSAVIGDKIILYWVHNSEDGSKQTKADIELIINGKASIITVDTANVNKEEKDRIYSHQVDLSQYTTGAEILWRVRTRGITFEYSDWSIQRTINVYAPPTAELHLGDDTGKMSSFPLNIKVAAGPNTQTALTYHISIKAEDTYITQDEIGNEITVNAGTEVYSKVFTNLSNTFEHNLTPDEVIFENNQFYKVEVTVSMNSGLTATATGIINVVWAEINYEPSGVVYFDDNYPCAYIKPYCLTYDSQMVTDVVLSVYRREPDGTFTMIAEELENNGALTVTDPHPSLDFARYRIVARNKTTSVNSFSDLPGIPSGEKSIIIQWDEKWSAFDYYGEDAISTPPWTGSLLRLPYNINVSENYNKDKSLVEYIGRKSPVSYYGTQEGVTMSLSTEIPKSDKETIYALRRLARYDGDVYIREPSGNGYNANVTVSMSINHKDVKIPVNIEVTRVEGDK